MGVAAASRSNRRVQLAAHPKTTIGRVGIFWLRSASVVWRFGVVRKQLRAGPGKQHAAVLHDASPGGSWHGARARQDASVRDRGSMNSMFNSHSTRTVGILV